MRIKKQPKTQQGRTSKISNDFPVLLPRENQPEVSKIAINIIKNTENKSINNTGCQRDHFPAAILVLFNRSRLGSEKKYRPRV